MTAVELPTEPRLRGAPSFEIDPGLDRVGLAACFAGKRRARVTDCLHPRGAVGLHRHLVDEVQWSTFLVADDERWGAAPQPAGPQADEQQAAMAARAHEGVRNGFACLYEAHPLTPMQFTGDRADSSATVLDEFLGFANSPAFLELMRAVTGLQIARTELLATRYRPGHFASGYSICPHPAAQKRLAAFALNLTPSWRPEWGGLLEFGAAGGYEVEAYVPAFNVLDVFALPTRHWVSAVTKFAEQPRFTVEGWLCGN